MLFHSSCFQSRGLRQGGAYPALSWELQVPVPAAAFCAGGGLAVVSFPLRYRLCQWRGAVNENTGGDRRKNCCCACLFGFQGSTPLLVLPRLC